MSLLVPLWWGGMWLYRVSQKITFSTYISIELMALIVFGFVLCLYSMLRRLSLYMIFLLCDESKKNARNPLPEIRIITNLQKKNMCWIEQKKYLTQDRISGPLALLFRDSFDNSSRKSTEKQLSFSCHKIALDRLSFHQLTFNSGALMFFSGINSLLYAATNEQMRRAYSTVCNFYTSWQP